ncbi:acyl-CoA dehydrogenase family protein [Paraburkholderia kirstenboschensis]|uniref:Acyl-CoA dehydrogenase family protein n=1 Tax=Paraburkholderia kirstenboschensis TaxID=1245436 RepID=A0ABZ0EFG6_9BURK|nr:acyl-CoA dehydrogenase family protein [Paraburkholderia kirstenboschensis]WOD15979.1 acyl-CoA dehydrogenase family protein [Paraburkholderia kirstenboschensis]
MDFQSDPGQDAFREEVRAFLREHLPAELRGNAIGEVRSVRERIKRWQGILNARGWGGPYWAREHGGTGWTVLQRLAFDEECAAAGAPTQDFLAQKLLGPALNAFASQGQRDEHVTRILSGERLWCQGFSEPGAGSDLASLHTSAEHSGGHYVVNGQKIWTSYAHEADWIFLLVRTDSTVRKQAGISFLLADMKTPGITVRPIRSIDGCHHLNEVFFDNVHVPVGNLVGAEGDGWKITKFLLNNEHAGAADLPLLRKCVSRLRALAVSQRVEGRRLIDDRGFALKLARLEAEVDAIVMMVQRVAAMEQDHSPAAHALGSMLKVRGTELQQKITGHLVEALGGDGAVAYAEPHDTTGGAPLPRENIGRGIATEMFFRRASTIYGGASEVQRGIIAKTLFQL